MEFSNIDNRFVCLTDSSKNYNYMEVLCPVLDLCDFVVECYPLEELVRLSNRKRIPIKGLVRTNSGWCASMRKVPMSVSFKKSRDKFSFGCFICKTLLFRFSYKFLEDFDVSNVDVNASYINDSLVFKLVVQGSSSKLGNASYFIQCCFNLQSKSLTSVEEYASPWYSQMDCFEETYLKGLHNKLTKTDNVLSAIKFDTSDVHCTQVYYVFNRKTARFAWVIGNDDLDSLRKAGYVIEGDETQVTKPDHCRVFKEFGFDDTVRIMYLFEDTLLGFVDIPASKLAIDNSDYGEFELSDLYGLGFESRAYFYSLDDRDCIIFISKLDYNTDQEYFEECGLFTPYGKVLVTAYFNDTKKLKVLHLSDISKLFSYVRKYGSSSF